MKWSSEGFSRLPFRASQEEVRCRRGRDGVTVSRSYWIQPDQDDGAIKHLDLLKQSKLTASCN